MSSGRRSTLLAALAAVAIAVLTGTAAGSSADHPRLHVGGFPTGIALDPVTDTIYVGNGTTNTLSLIDGKTCSADRSSGCAQHVTAATAGLDPIGVAVDKDTDTIYVVNFSGTLAVIDGRHCNAADTSRCKVKPTTVKVGSEPQFLALDAATDTIYVANGGSNTISVIDGSTCNAITKSGCGHVKASVPVGPIPFAVAVNDVTHSIYITDAGAHTISVLDGNTCNAQDVRGCRHRPTINVGQTPGGIAVDTQTDTIYVTGESSSDVTVINGKTCNAETTSGCAQKPFHVFSGAGARGIAVNQSTNTIYVANTGANTVSVIDGTTCNATIRRGCIRPVALAPVGLSPRRIAINEATNTVYVTNAGSNSVTMLDGRTCNGRVRKGCGKLPSGGVVTA